MNEIPIGIVTVSDRAFAGVYEDKGGPGIEAALAAILSRQIAGLRGRSLIVNLPGKPSAIRTCLDAVFPAIPYCLDLTGGDRLETNKEVCIAFRPKA